MGWVVGRGGNGREIKRGKRLIRFPSKDINQALLFLGVQEQIFPPHYELSSKRRKHDLKADIICARRPGSTFLDNNAHQLDYLFSRAKEQYRKKAKVLHPDYGGEHAQCAELNRLWDYVKRWFRANTRQD